MSATIHLPVIPASLKLVRMRKLNYALKTSRYKFMVAFGRTIFVRLFWQLSVSEEGLVAAAKETPDFLKDRKASVERSNSVRNPQARRCVF